MLDGHFPGSLVGGVNHAGRDNTHGHHQGVADFVLGRAKFQRFLDVPFQATLTLHCRRHADGYQFLGLRIKGGRTEISPL